VVHAGVRRWTVKYLCLVYPREGFGPTSQNARDFIELRSTMTAAGVFLGAGQLRPVSSSTTVRVRDGETLLTDGPFAEIKEHVGGFVLLECADLDEAVKWTAMLPGIEGGGAEIRPLVDYPM
jgi:hypothetical protein